MPALGNGQEAQEFEVSIGKWGRSKSVWATGDFASKELKKGQNKSPKIQSSDPLFKDIAGNERTACQCVQKSK